MTMKEALEVGRVDWDCNNDFDAAFAVAMGLCVFGAWAGREGATAIFFASCVWWG